MKRIIAAIFFIGIAVYFMSCSSYPPMYDAAWNGNLEKIKKLVEAGEDINTGKYHTPLEGAAIRGNLAIVKYLVSQGAGDTQEAFDEAMRNDQYEVAAFLIAAGYVDANAKARVFYSLLNDEKIPFETRIQKAKEIGSGKLNSPYLLRMVGPENYQRTIDFFDITISDKVDELGNSILHIASEYFNYDLVMYLLENGFDVNALDNGGHTALFSAITAWGPSINWAKPVTENEAAAKINFISDMPYYGSNGQSFQEKQVRIISALLDSGVNINHQNNEGWTVLHFTSAGYSRGLWEMLVSKGADKNIKTNFGRTSEEILALRK